MSPTKLLRREMSFLTSSRETVETSSTTLVIGSNGWSCFHSNLTQKGIDLVDDSVTLLIDLGQCICVLSSKVV